MRKIYKSLLCALAAFTSLSASADTFKLYIEDASTIKVTTGYSWNPEEQPVVDGWNTYELEGGSYFSPQIKVTAVAPWIIDKVTNENGESQPLSDGAWIGYPSNEGKEYSYTIEVVDLEESRTASCTVNVDDASLVKVVRSGTNSVVELVNGSNPVKYNPNLEKYLTISNVEYGEPLYQVLIDDAPAENSYEQYSVTLYDGCNIDITARMPEGNATISFVYSEGAENAIINPMVNSEPAEIVDNKLIVPIGSKVSWSRNPLYGIDEIKIDGAVNSWYGDSFSIEGVVKQDMTVELSAHKYAEYKVIVKCTDPSHFKLYAGEYEYNKQRVELTGTENEIMVSEIANNLFWSANPGCTIISVKKDGEPVEYSTVRNIDHDGVVVEFETESIDFNCTAILYLEGLDTELYTQSIIGGDENHTYFSSRNDTNYFEGYNTFKFADIFNPFTFQFYGYDQNLQGFKYTQLYVNDEYYPYDPEGTGYSYYPAPVTLADGDIVKIFVSRFEPTVCHVQVEADAENTDKFEVVRDIIKTVTVEEFEGFDTFANTRMEIKPVEDSILKVTVNGTEVAKNDDGNFMFTVTPVEAEGETTREAGVTNVKVEFVGSGIDMIESEAGANAKAVYNLQGVKVADSLENLPAGLYITNGKKVIVK